MASISQLIENVAKIRRFVGIYLDVENPTPKQRAALQTDLRQLDRNLAALRDALGAPVPVVVAPVVERAPKPAELDVPNFGRSNVISSRLYGDFAAAWLRATFPEIYADYPPFLRPVSPDAIVTAATEDGCLAQVCAAGLLDAPGGAWHDLGDWSLFTGVVSASEGGAFRHRVYIMGELVATSDLTGPDGLPFAIANGVEA